MYLCMGGTSETGLNGEMQQKAGGGDIGPMAYKEGTQQQRGISSPQMGSTNSGREKVPRQIQDPGIGAHSGV